MGEGALERIRRPPAAADLNKTAPRAGTGAPRDLLEVSYSPGLRPNTQRRDPSGRRHMVTWPSGGATGIASS